MGGWYGVRARGPRWMTKRAEALSMEACTCQPTSTPPTHTPTLPATAALPHLAGGLVLGAPRAQRGQEPTPAGPRAAARPGAGAPGRWAGGLAGICLGSKRVCQSARLSASHLCTVPSVGSITLWSRHGKPHLESPPTTHHPPTPPFPWPPPPSQTGDLHFMMRHSFRQYGPGQSPSLAPSEAPTPAGVAHAGPSPLAAARAQNRSQPCSSRKRWTALCQQYAAVFAVCLCSKGLLARARTATLPPCRCIPVGWLPAGGLSHGQPLQLSQQHPAARLANPALPLPAAPVPGHPAGRQRGRRRRRQGSRATRARRGSRGCR